MKVDSVIIIDLQNVINIISLSENTQINELTGFIF